MGFAYSLQVWEFSPRVKPSRAIWVPCESTTNSPHLQRIKRHPPLIPAGKHRVPWGQQPESGSWGCWKRAGKVTGWRREKKRKGEKLWGVENLGAANLDKLFYEPPKGVLVFTWNFGKILESKQCSRELCPIQMSLSAASQIYLVIRAGRRNSDFILPFPSLEERKVMDKVLFLTLCGGTELRRAAPNNHPVSPSLITIRLGDHHCLVYLGLFMGCVTPTTQLQEWWTELDPRDAGTASLGALRHNMVPSIDLFVMDVVLSMFWKEN